MNKELPAGSTLSHYRIVSKVGEGGMGEVYLAQDTKLDRKVALKILPRNVAANRDRMERFVREAKSAAALNHPNVAHIYEIGESNGTHFIAMEFIDGQTLREKIHGDKAPLPKLLKYLIQVAQGLSKAHAAGIVHRDLKPDNIMITRDDYAKILDFGLAKLVEPQRIFGYNESGSSEIATAVMQQPVSPVGQPGRGSEHSTPGMVMGTIGYMSPEQASGRVNEIDHRSDIFSFGCILFEAATGQRAFEGKDALDSLHKIVHAPTPQLKDANPLAPAELRDIKPENIMLRQDGYAKVLDFGLAKLSELGAVATGSSGSEGATRIQVNTNPGVVMGTVSYMSPEQARGNPTDARTDIWSFGVVLYEMLARKVPFTGDTASHTIVSILEKEPLVLENLPAELQRIVRKALTKDVEMRYQSARDLLIDLKNLRRDLDIQGELERSIIPNRELATGSIDDKATQVYASGAIGTTYSGSAAAATQQPSSASSLEYAVTQAKSHKLATAIVALVLLGAILTIGYFAFGSKFAGPNQIESIAVLPFINQSGNADVEYLSDGMTETLTEASESARVVYSAAA